MFGTIAVPAPRTDLDGESLAQCIVIYAIANRDSRDEHKRRAADYRKNGEHAAADLQEQMADWSRDRMMGATAPLRIEIQRRTARERIQAEWQVKTGLAEFIQVICSGETCDDCERPLWQHIQVADFKWLCPFGREFWQLARALILRDDCTMSRCPHVSRLRELATP